MKKFVFISLVVVVLTSICGILLYCSFGLTNPWNAKVVGDIPTPSGYNRVNFGYGSYAEYLRNLPLKSKGSKIMLYTGGKARLQFLGAAVIDQKLLSDDEQCADVTMRLRAEYLWENGRYDEIRFSDTRNKNVQYTGGASRKAFETYMRRVYGVCNTFSVYHETQPHSIKNVKPGDVFVYPARSGRKYGHAVIVVDVAKDQLGNIAVMCAEGNTPARDQHIIRNLDNKDYNPWFIFNGDEEEFKIAIFTFYKNELRHY